MCKERFPVRTPGARAPGLNAMPGDGDGTATDQDTDGQDGAARSEGRGIQRAGPVAALR